MQYQINKEMSYKNNVKEDIANNISSINSSSKAVVLTRTQKSINEEIENKSFYMDGQADNIGFHEIKDSKNTGINKKNKEENFVEPNLSGIKSSSLHSLDASPSNKKIDALIGKIEEYIQEQRATNEAQRQANEAQRQTNELLLKYVQNQDIILNKLTGK